jgi:hypothetical protein
MRMRWPETDGEPYCPGCGHAALLFNEPRPLQVLGKGMQCGVHGHVGHGVRVPLTQFQEDGHRHLAVSEFGQGQGCVAAFPRTWNSAQDGLGDAHEAARGDRGGIR